MLLCAAAFNKSTQPELWASHPYKAIDIQSTAKGIISTTLKQGRAFDYTDFSLLPFNDWRSLTSFSSVYFFPYCISFHPTYLLQLMLFKKKPTPSFLLSVIIPIFLLLCLLLSVCLLLLHVYISWMVCSCLLAWLDGIDMGLFALPCSLLCHAVFFFFFFPFMPGANVSWR